MKIKNLLNRMECNISLKSSKNTIDACSSGLKNKKKAKIKSKIYLEFQKYLEELKKKEKE